MDLVHIPGDSNVADPLSRRPDYLLTLRQTGVLTRSTSGAMEASGTTGLPTKILQQLEKGYGTDPFFALPAEELASKHRIRGFNRVFYKDGSRLCIPATCTDLKRDILHDYHDAPTAGHPGVNNTVLLLQRDFFWPGLKEEVRAYVSSCSSCQRNKPRNHGMPGHLHPHGIPADRWSSISMDLMIQLPRTQRGYDALVVFVDRLSK